MHENFRSYHGFQKAKNTVKYRTTLVFSLTRFFITFSIDFTGRFLPGLAEEKYSLVAVEHLPWWSIAGATNNHVSDESVKFLKKEIIFCFGPQKMNISDNGRCVTAKYFQLITKKNNVRKKIVL